jgi:hypothetical protein
MSIQVVEGTLSAQDQADYQELDTVVREGMGAFIRVGEALLVIRERNLWAVEFDSWDDYCLARLDRTGRRSNQMIAASHAARVIESAGAIPPSNENQVRSIAGKSDQDIANTWQSAVDAYGSSPTGEQVANTSERLEESPPGDDDDSPDETVRRLVYGSKLSPIIQKMTTGELSPEAALELCDVLKGCEKRVVGDMLQLQVTDTVVIRRLNKLYRKGRDTYTEIAASGYLQMGEEREAIPAAEITMRDLRRYLDWKYDEHVKSSVADRVVRLQEPAIVVEAKKDFVTLQIQNIGFDLEPEEVIIVSIERKR